MALADLEENPSDVGSENGDINIDPHFDSDFEVEFEQEEHFITLKLEEDAATIFHREDSDTRSGRNTLASQGRHHPVPDYVFPDPQPRATTTRDQASPVSYIFPDIDVTPGWGRHHPEPRPSTSREQDPPAAVFAHISSAGSSTDEMSVSSVSTGNTGNTPTGNTPKRRRLSRPAPGVARRYIPPVGAEPLGSDPITDQVEQAIQGMLAVF